MGVFFTEDPGPLRLQSDAQLPPVDKLMLSDVTFPNMYDVTPQQFGTYSFANSLMLAYSFTDVHFCNTSGKYEIIFNTTNKTNKSTHINSNVILNCKANFLK